MTWLLNTVLIAGLLANTAVIVWCVLLIDQAQKRHVTAQRCDYHHWLYMNGYLDENGFLR